MSSKLATDTVVSSTDDLNVALIHGKLAAPIEVQTYPSGAVANRLLVTVVTHDPVKRVDVLPVTVWDDDTLDLDAPIGSSVHVRAQIRRRFWAAEDGRRSRLELVASEIAIHRPQEGGN